MRRRNIELSPKGQDLKQTKQNQSRSEVPYENTLAPDTTRLEQTVQS